MCRILEPRRAVVALVVITCELTACSSGNSPAEPQNAGSIGVSITSATVSIIPGQSATTAITVSRSGGFGGAISLALDGAPAGLSGVFAPASIGSGATSSTLTLTAAPTAAIGNHKMAIRATGQGVGAASAALAVAVQAAPAIALALDLGSATVSQGASRTVAIQITRTNFTRAVSIAVSGMPSGVTASVAPASVTANAAALSVVVSPTAAPGSYTLTITGQAQGLENAIAALQVNVIGAFAWAQVSAGKRHTCGVSTAGAAYCWGGGLNGALGDGTATDRNTPVRVSGTQTWSQVSAGEVHTCGVTTAREAYCWGEAFSGSLGDGSPDGVRLVPAAVAGGHQWVTVSVGLLLTCGITIAADAYCWGADMLYRIGSSAQMNPTPALLVGGQKWSTISVGRLHACGVTTSGGAYCWGRNAEGQVGDGALGPRPAPVLVAGGHSWSTVAPGEAQHTCGVTTAGATYCWGSGPSGELGTRNGPAGVTTAPALVLGGRAWRAATAGLQHSCGVTDAGAALCWGFGGGGVLGNGGVENAIQPVPGPVVGGLVFSTLDAGAFHTCGVTTAGRAYCWGANHRGMLGAGPLPLLSGSPLQVTDPASGVITGK